MKECQCKEFYEAYVATGHFAFSEQRFVILENEEGQSYARVVDKVTLETGLAKTEISQPVVDKEIAPVPVFQTQELKVPYNSLDELPKGLRDELFETKSESSKRWQIVRLAEAIIC